LKKRYISQGTVCKVTFLLPAEIDAQAAAVAGDFNGWDPAVNPMTRLKSGVWKAEVKLDAGHEYQFRYQVDGAQWRNDPEADGHVPHPYGGENSVVKT
jgi:1,4-alpha-glucan branching enzyme